MICIYVCIYMRLSLRTCINYDGEGHIVMFSEKKLYNPIGYGQDNRHKTAIIVLASSCFHSASQPESSFFPSIFFSISGKILMP